MHYRPKGEDSANNKEKRRGGGKHFLAFLYSIRFERFAQTKHSPACALFPNAYTSQKNANFRFMRNNELLFRLLRIPIEAILVGVAFYVAREIRLVTDLIPGVQLPIQRISESALALFAVSAAVLYVGVFAVSGLYRFRTTNSWGEEFLRIVSASFSWFLYYVALVYLSVGYFFQTEIPRLIIFFAFFLSIFAVGIERFLFSKIQMMLLRFGFLPKRRVLVLTESSNSVVLSEIQKNP